MRGVSKSSKRRWRVQYGRSISEFYDSEKEADQRREQLEKEYGIPRNGRRKDYSGFENRHFEYVGDTNESSPDGRSQLGVFLNKHSGKYEVKRPHDVVNCSLTGINPHVAHAINDHPGVTKKNDKYQVQITAKGHKYCIGTFINLSDAQKAYQKSLNDVLDGKVPAIAQHAQSNSKTGVKNVSFQSSENKYRFKKILNGQPYLKRFNTLSEAVTYRNKFLNEHNLPIPD